jgi:hypothetical protein
MGVRQTFNNFQPSIRRLLIVSFVVGLLLLIGFSLTDVGVNVTLGSWDPKPNWLKQFNAEWFHSHAYIPNILAAITGFFIGVLLRCAAGMDRRGFCRRHCRRGQEFWDGFIWTRCSNAANRLSLAWLGQLKHIGVSGNSVLKSGMYLASSRRVMGRLLYLSW